MRLVNSVARYLWDPDGLWAQAALSNRVESGDPGAEYESVSLTTSRLLAPNFRLVAEAARDVPHKNWRRTAGLVTAF